jgi:hypothetical protein
MLFPGDMQFIWNLIRYPPFGVMTADCPGTGGSDGNPIFL